MELLHSYRVGVNAMNKTIDISAWGETARSKVLAEYKYYHDREKFEMDIKDINKIAIFNSFPFHYEIFGFILDYAKLHNYHVDIFNHSNGINNNDLGWGLFYKHRFNNFTQLHSSDFKGDVENYKLFFVTTDDDPEFKKEWIKDNVICLNHYYKIRIDGFKHYFNIAPFRESELEYIYPCYNMYKSEDKKLDDEYINVTVVGGRLNDQPFDINRLMCKNVNKKLRLNIITKNDWGGVNLHDVIKDKKTINDINYCFNTDTKEMFDILKYTNYMLLTNTPNNDHNTCKSSSGSTQLSLSALGMPIICKTANEHLKLRNSIEFDMNSNEPIHLDDNIDFKELENERDFHIHKRNILLEWIDNQH